MTIQKQASAWQSVVKVFEHVAPKLGRASQWVWEVSRGASRFAGKRLSVLGKLEHVLPKIEAFEKYMLEGIGKLHLSELIKTPEKASEVLKAAKASKLIDEAKILEELRHMPEVQEAISGISRTGTIPVEQVKDALLKGNTIVQKAFDAQAMTKLAPALNELDNIAKQSSEFMKMVANGLAQLKNSAIGNPDRLRVVADASKRIDEILASGMKDADAFKSISAVFDEAAKGTNFVGSLQEQAAKAATSSNTISRFMQALRDTKALSVENRAIASGIQSAASNFEFVHSSHALNIKNFVAVKGALVTILFGASMIGGGLIGENVKLFKELKEINHKIIDALKELPVRDDAVGNGWKSNRDRLITQLSRLDGVDIEAYEQANGSSMSEQDVETTITGLQDLSERFTAVGNVLDEIATSKALEGSYEQGSARLAQDAAAAIDNMNPAAAFGLTGHISGFNTVKSLAEKGLEALRESGEKISRSSDELNSKLMEGDMGTEQNITASYITDQFISSGTLIRTAYSFREIDKIKLKLIKKAYGFGVALALAEALADGGNALTKLYIHSSDMWSKLDANINEIIEHLENLNEFTPDSAEGEQFKENTSKLISSLKSNIKAFSDNFPMDTKEVLGQENSENPKLKQLADEIASGSGESKLEIAKSALKNISAVYDTFMSTHWGDQYAEYAKSWWQSIATGVGTALTWFSGESILDKYSRMVYEAKSGAAMIAALLAQIDKVIEGNKQHIQS